ncbi:phospholipase A2 inhibitor gamma subunit B-like [Scomber scombrus]|uniref:Phospholipase A2 inhibitor gamma subunit B-like n=1 Tax=Scomber scombrus TaxID=13677 RepID=A0AAV1Q7K4_SCOSC
MMKLILYLTLIWTLSTTAKALQCWVGEGSDYSTRLCKPGDGDRCASISTQVGRIFKTSTERRCVPSSLFSEGTQEFSHNVGYGSTFVSVVVCKTDNCNTNDIMVGGIFKTSTERRCVPSSLFSEGYQTFAYNVGSGPTFVVVIVCKTDNCNTHQLIGK